MNDIAFKVIIKNDGIDDIIFKTIMLKGEKGDKGDAGGVEIDDSTTSATKTWSSQKINSMIAQTETIEDVAIASFSDGADDVPVSELIVDITAVQAGSGVPSPDNVRAISGFDSGVVSVCGKNLLDYNAWKSSTATTARATTVFQNNGVSVTATANDGYVFPSFRIPCVSGETYTLSWNSETNIEGLVYIFFDDNTYVYVQNGTQKRTFTVPQGNNIRLRFGVTTSGQTINYSNIQVELGDTVTNFEEYKGNTYTFTFGQTVYGGRFDNKGNLVVTHEVVDMGTLNYVQGFSGFYTTGLKDFVEIPSSVANSQLLSPIFSVGNTANNDNMYIQFAPSYLGWVIFLPSTSYATASDFKTAMNGVMLVYKLANPFTLEIESQDIPTLLGENNIYSNTGNINKLVYFKTGSEAVARMIEAYMRASN